MVLDDAIRIVPAEELAELVPRGRAATAAWEPTLTKNLRAAMLDWLLATAGKVQRLGDGMSTMLVHTTQRITQQNELSAVVRSQLNLMQTYAPGFAQIDMSSDLNLGVAIFVVAALMRHLPDLEDDLNALLIPLKQVEALYKKFMQITTIDGDR
ncbi:MAG: hypothetical protein ACR2KL_02915 [Nocardioidaceae bacterium]